MGHGKMLAGIRLDTRVQKLAQSKTKAVHTKHRFCLSNPYGNRGLINSSSIVLPCHGFLSSRELSPRSGECVLV